MRLIFIRHGEPDYTTDSLTDVGKEEAILLSKRVANWENIDKIYLSPFGRAQQTAKYSMDALSMTGTTLPWLREFNYEIDIPETGFSYIPWDFYPNYWMNVPEMFEYDKWIDTKVYSSNPDIKPKYLEVCNGIDSILAEYGYTRTGNLYTTEHKTGTIDDNNQRVNSDHQLLFFCHLGVTFAMISHLLHIPYPQMLHQFFVAPTSVTILTTEERIPGFASFRAECIGDVMHLKTGERHLTPTGFFADYFQK